MRETFSIISFPILFFLSFPFPYLQVATKHSVSFLKIQKGGTASSMKGFFLRKRSVRSWQKRAYLRHQSGAATSDTHEASVHSITQDCSSNKTKKSNTFRSEEALTWRKQRPVLTPPLLCSSDQRSSSPPPTHQILRKSFEIDGAKQKLHELCVKKKWPKPIYSLEKHEGPPHDKKCVLSVQIPTVDGILYIEGDEMSRVKEAQNSAASWIVRALQESNYL
ncbi:hypothetical protein ACB092_02G007000 [Castanea dentata]